MDACQNYGLFPAADLCYSEPMKRLSQFHAILVTILVAAFLSCGGVHRGHLFPVPDENTTFLKDSKGAAVLRSGVAVVCAPLNEVKEADGFYIVLFNKTGQFISFDRNQVRLLDDNGNSYRQLSKSERNALLGGKFQPKPPMGIRAEVFRWDRTLAVEGDWVSPLKPEEIMKTSVMNGGKLPFFVFFRRVSGKSSRLTLFIPGVEIGGTMDKETFVFRFEVQKS